MDLKNKKKKIFLSGHKGLVGSSILNQLNTHFCDHNIITIDKKYINLLNQNEVLNFFENQKFDLVINCAAKVGGIFANKNYKADFIYENLQIQNNVIHSSYLTNVKKLIFIATSSVYPKFAQQPMKEEYLLTSCLENSNEPYSIAKIAGIKMCESYFYQYGCNFLSICPTNLYGPNDHFDDLKTHVLPSLIHRFHTSKINNIGEVKIWGTGTALREFMFVDDMAYATIQIIKKINASDIYEQNISHLNIGSGIEISIGNLAEKIAKIIGYNGKIVYDLSKPDGCLRKLVDISRQNKIIDFPKVDLDLGIATTYEWYLKNIACYEK